MANPDLSADWLFNRHPEEKLYFSEPEEKYHRPNSLPKDQAEWAYEIKQEMQELYRQMNKLYRRINQLHRQMQELEWKVKDR
jgi:Lon protease-like protein